MKKIYLILMMSMFLISLTSANLGTYQIRENVSVRGDLSASSVNITIYYPNSSKAINNQDMINIYGDIWEYNFSRTNTLGVYIYDYYSSNESIQNFFKISLYGGDPIIAAHLTFLILILGSFGSLIWINIRFPKERREKMWKKTMRTFTDYRIGADQNLGEAMMLLMGYGMMKIMYVYYYVIIFALSFFLLNFAESFGINSLTMLLGSFVNIIAWGFIPMFIIMIFTFWNILERSMKDIEEMMLGITNNNKK